MINLTIILNTRVDFLLAKDNILAIKKTYENEQFQPKILLVADGVDPTGLEQWCETEKVGYIKGERLYLSNHGGSWIKRWLEEGVKAGTDWILKIDPDTRIFKPIPLKHNVKVDVVSPYFPKDDEKMTRLNGSFHLIRRNSAIKLLESNVLDDEKYKFGEFQFEYIGNQPDKMRFKNYFDRSVCIKEDVIFADACKTLDFETKDASSFVNCWWRVKPDENELIKNPVAQHPYYKIENIKKKAFGIGLSRTGTSALNNALNLLGYDSVHHSNAILTDEDFWECLECYDAYTDIPMPKYYKKVNELYPDSKFILTVRYLTDWMASFKFYVKEWKMMQERTKDLLTPEQTIRREKISNFLRENSTHIFEYNVPDYVDDKMIDYIISNGYNKHYSDVRNYFKDKPGKLLVLDVSEGNAFVQLAEFLESPVKPLSTNIPIRNSRNEAISVIRDTERAILRAYNQRIEQEERIKIQKENEEKEKKEIEKVEKSLKKHNEEEE